MIIDLYLDSNINPIALKNRWSKSPCFYNLFIQRIFFLISNSNDIFKNDWSISCHEIFSQPNLKWHTDRSLGPKWSNNSTSCHLVFLNWSDILSSLPFVICNNLTTLEVPHYKKFRNEHNCAVYLMLEAIILTEKMASRCLRFL